MAEAEDFWELMESHFKLIDYMAGVMRMKEDANKLLNNAGKPLFYNSTFETTQKCLV